MRIGIWRFIVASVFFATTPLALFAQTLAWTLERPAASFDRARITTTKTLEQIKLANNLGGAVGWFEYDFSVPKAGWYELIVLGHVHEVEFLLGPSNRLEKDAQAYIPGSQGYDGKDDKVGNFWITEGRHTLRMQRHFWTGFPDLKGFSLRASDERLAATVRVTRPSSHGIYRKGECGGLEVHYGPRTTDTPLPVTWVNARTFATLKSDTIVLRSTKTPKKLIVILPCDIEGQFVLYFNGGAERITNRDIHYFSYEVIDTSKPPAISAGAPDKTLVQSIDLTVTPPDYAAGDTTIVQKTFGAYRESGDRGWLDYQNSRIKVREASWFAYTLNSVKKQRPYLVEIDYPDDAERTFAIALRESAPLSYPVAGGVSSGGEFALTDRLQTHSLLFWPRAEGTRIVFLPARNGTRAAAARIRVYRLDGDLPPLRAAKPGNRNFVNWYEEGTNFMSMYGAPDETPNGIRVALERWAQTAAYVGIDTLSPTTVIYSFGLYPSRYNTTFSQPWAHDTLRHALLIAEKHGLRVLPELHPRADELSLRFAGEPEINPKPNLMVSKDGKTLNDLPPHFSPVHPMNQDWYLGLIEELANNYRDSPALIGVSLRLMQWKNPAFHNFHSLDWGYDDYTIAEFEKDTGIAIPVPRGDPARFSARYLWLIRNARERWVTWRCERVAGLLKKAVTRVREVRSDLKLYLPVFGWPAQGSTVDYHPAWLKEAGIDPALLGKIDGLLLINATHSYGRRDDAMSNHAMRNNLVDPTAMRMLMNGAANGRFMSNTAYFEAIEVVAPPERLGFPSNTKRTWMSAVVNPSGRNYLERYALQLADTDAIWLGDGGNAYTIGQPELREFLSEYRQLPATPFRRRSDARSPIAVWELAQKDSYLFYLVNRTAHDTQIILQLQGQGNPESLSSGNPLSTANGTLRISLKPFQLLAYRAPPSMAISKATAP